MGFLWAALAAGSAHAAGIDILVRDASGAPLADAGIYALPASGGGDARGAAAMDIEQVDREFVPYLTVVQTGTLVGFPNRDPILHHVYSFSAARPFEIKLYSGRSPVQVLFDKPGVVTLGCNIHDWMVGYVLVVPTPHFAKTGEEGRAQLRNLPAGSYELHAWHPRQRIAAPVQALMLDPPSHVQARFVVDAAPRRPKYKPPLDRPRY